MAGRLKIPRDPLVAFLLPVFVCLTIAAVVAWVSPSQYVATTRLEVKSGPNRPEDPKSSSAQESREARTQTEVIRSERVLALAAQKLKLASMEELKESVVPLQVAGTNVIEVQATRPNAQEAKSWANAVTDSFVEFKRASAISNSVAAAELIERGIRNAQARITTLEAEIGKNPSNAGALRQQQAALNGQVKSLQNQLRNLPQAEAVAAGDVTVLATADTARAASGSDPLQNMGVAAAAGGVLGAPLAFFAYKRRRRRAFLEQPANSAVADGFTRGTPEEATVAGTEIPNERNSQESDEAGVAIAASRYDRPPPAASRNHATLPVDQKLSREMSNLSVHLNRSLEAYNTHILGALSSRQDSHEAKLSEAVQWMRRQLSETVEMMGARLSAAMNQSLEAYARHVVDEMSARQNANGAVLSPEAVQAVQGITDQVSASVQESLEVYGNRVLAQLAAQQESSALELKGSTERLETHFKTLAEKLESAGPGYANRLLALMKQMNVQIHALQERVSGDFDGFREVFIRRMDAGQAQIDEALTRKEQESQQLWTKAAVQTAQRLQQLRTEVFDKLNDQSEKLEKVSEEVKASNLVRYLEDRLNRVEQESSDRLAKLAAELTRGVQDLRDGILEKVSAQQESIGRMVDSVGSVEAKLIGGNGLAGRMGGLFEWVGGQIKAVDARVVSAVEQINEGLKEGTQSSRAELAERLSSVDAEVSERLGRVAVRLSQSLESLRREISEKAASNQKTIATMLDSLEVRVAGESSETIRRLTPLLEEFTRQMQAAEAMTARGLSEIKAEVLSRAETTEAQFAEQLARMNAAMGRRVEDVIGELNDKFQEASAKTTKKLTGQLQDVTRRLQAIEGQVEDQGSSVAERLSLRLKAIERAVVALGRRDAIPEADEEA